MSGVGIVLMLLLMLIMVKFGQIVWAVIFGAALILMLFGGIGGNVKKSTRGIFGIMTEDVKREMDIHEAEHLPYPSGATIKHLGKEIAEEASTNIFAEEGDVYRTPDIGMRISNAVRKLFGALGELMGGGGRGHGNGHGGHH